MAYADPRSVMLDVWVANCRRVMGWPGKYGFTTLKGSNPLMSWSSESFPSWTACMSAAPVIVLLIEPMFINVSAVKGRPCSLSAKP